MNLFINKRLSQNFLTDPNIAKKIVRKAEVSEQDIVLEIGPGLGALTQALVDAKAQIIALEKDRRFISHLQDKFPDITLFEADFLKFPLDRLKRERKIKVVANLPYNITTPILTKVLERGDLFSSITVMVQEEVARRIVAKPHTSEIGAITYFVHYYGDPKILFKVPPHLFYPAPKVESAILQIILKNFPSNIDQEKLFVLIRTAYQQRRKMLRVSLKNLYHPTQVEEALHKLSLPITSRPEELSLQDFIGILTFCL